MNQLNQSVTDNLTDRRKFIAQALKASIASAFVLSSADTHAAWYAAPTKSYTVGEIMDLVIKDVPHAPFEKTVDTLKSGSRDMVVTGIVTTMFATIDIIHKAIAAKANFIIAHEPTFFNHTDDLKWVSPNKITDEKKALLDQNKITVWRLHDYLHSFVPDSVTYGLVKAAGWLPYYKTGQRVLDIPETVLGEVATHLKRSLSIGQVRVVGNFSRRCAKIGLMPGAAGGQAQIAFVEKEQPDVLIVGEVHEWETAEYIRDSLALGGKTALIVLGHTVSEEPGLQWLQEYLQPKLPGITVQHIPTPNPFVFI